MFSSFLIKRFLKYKLPQNVGKYYKVNPKQEALFEHNLSQDSFVVDLGGFIGEFAGRLQKKYNCFIDIYEPVPKLIKDLETKFKHTNKVKLFKFGAGKKDATLEFSVDGQSSSLYREGTKKSTIIIKDIAGILQDYQKQGKKIDLMAINIEGAEFEVLERLIETNLLDNVESYLIQFHYILPWAGLRRRRIQNALKKNYVKVFDFPFVWEKWEKKKP